MLCKRLFFALSCLVLAVMFAAPSASFASEHASQADKDKKDDAKSKKKEAATITGGLTGGNEPIYLHMAPITFPVIDDYGAQQIVTILVDIQAQTYDMALKMQDNMPKLKDAVLQALYGGMSDGSMRNSHMLDIPKIKSSIIDTINRMFGVGYAQDALIQAVAQRKL